MRFPLVAIAFLWLTACEGAMRPPESPTRVLPLRAVRLYENGVGYFEREGVLAPGDGSTLSVPASHVDDALKTLIVLSRGGVQVSGIEFPSVVPDGAARALAGLPTEGDDPADYEHVLHSLIGFRVEIASDGRAAMRGRLLDVARDAPAAELPRAGAAESKHGPKPPGPPVYSLLVVTDDGALSRVATDAIRTIRPLDRAFTARLRTAVDALGGRSAQLRRELRVRATATAPVRIGYIAETPVWRASYRLVLAANGDGAALQGWALVHNDTDEAWTNVDVELVNGAPDSFLFPMAAPRYTRRPLDTPDDELSTVPQLALRTSDGLWGDHVGDETGEGGLGLSGEGEGGGGYGEGIGLGGIGTMGHGAGTGGVAESEAVSIGDLSRVASAKGKDEGRLFSYHLAQKVSLGAHGSSLLPLLEHAVALRRFTRFDDRGGPGRAAVRFSNDSPYILPAGPVAIYEASGFSGETLLDRLRPRDRAFLEYGVDLDAALTAENKPVSSKVVHLSLAPGSERLLRHEVVVSERRLQIENHAATPRSIGYALSTVVKNAKVEGADELDYDVKDALAIAFFTAPPRSSFERTLRVTEARAVTTRIGDLTEQEARVIADGQSLPAEERAVLRAALPRVAALSSAERRASELRRRTDELDADLKRNRGHLEAMKAGAGATNPIAMRVVSLERDRDENRRALSALADEITALERAALQALAPLPDE